MPQSDSDLLHSLLFHLSFGDAQTSHSEICCGEQLYMRSYCAKLKHSIDMVLSTTHNCSHTVQVRQRVRRALTATRVLQRSAPTPSSLLQRWRRGCACVVVHWCQAIHSLRTRQPGFLRLASQRAPREYPYGFWRTNLSSGSLPPVSMHTACVETPCSCVLNDSGFCTACDAMFTLHTCYLKQHTSTAPHHNDRHVCQVHRDSNS
jgi:hypothetical protein